MPSQVVKSFLRPQFSPRYQKELPQNGTIRSLPDLIEFNAIHNSSHLFCVQAEEDSHESHPTDCASEWRLRSITFGALKGAVDACCVWLSKNIPQDSERTLSQKMAPVALYLESDVGLFIYVAALLKMNIPVCSFLLKSLIHLYQQITQVMLLSIRLSPTGIEHLLRETGTRTVLVSNRTKRMIKSTLADITKVVSAVPYSHFFVMASDPITLCPAEIKTHIEENDRNVLILHSSGTTGNPKPVYLAHRYLLGYAACHEFAAGEDVQWANFSTLPLFHGFGFLAPSLSLSIGMYCCFPPSAIVPASHSTLGLLRLFRAQSMITVPSILEDMLEYDSPQALISLAKLRFLAVGGGPLKSEIGQTLIDRRVKLLNHYGVTEIGAIAPIFEPDEDYDWKYLRLRKDLGLELHSLSEDRNSESLERYKVVGFPPGWSTPFHIQDEIEKGPCQQHVEIRVVGRRDELIVLKTGEKVSPLKIEEELSQHPAIKTAVCIGHGQYELLVLIEPIISRACPSAEFIDEIWNVLSNINPSMDQHARISLKKAIMIKPAGKVLPRSDKGSVMRTEVHKLFAEEIQAAYEAIDSETQPDAKVVEVDGLKSCLEELARTIMAEKIQIDALSWHAQDDLFELGMDSLQAMRFARSINGLVSREPLLTNQRINKNFIYQHPSVSQLVEALTDTKARHDANLTETLDRGRQIKSFASGYLKHIEDIATSDVSGKGGIVILLTGSTGSLGAHILGYLSRNPNVARIICLIRKRRAYDQDEKESFPRARQESANTAAGVSLDPEAWAKITYMEVNMLAANLGLSATELSYLISSLTHIVHLAWPMDFSRRLESFRPHLDALQSLIDLAHDVHEARPNVRPRLLFTSSIAVVRHHVGEKGNKRVPEKCLEEPLTTASIGYAEAKWICERILCSAARFLGNGFYPMIVRVGQLSGPEKDGIWKKEEHIPVLIKASQKVSAFPSMEGVSL